MDELNYATQAGRVTSEQRRLEIQIQQLIRFLTLKDCPFIQTLALVRNGNHQNRPWGPEEQVSGTRAAGLTLRDSTFYISDMVSSFTAS